MSDQAHEENAKKASDLIFQICLEASRRIDTAIESNEPVQITKLAKDLAKHFSVKNHVEMYHILRLYVSLRPDIKAKQGPNGGIVRVIKIGSVG